MPHWLRTTLPKAGHTIFVFGNQPTHLEVQWAYSGHLPRRIVHCRWWPMMDSHAGKSMNFHVVKTQHFSLTTLSMNFKEMMDFHG